MLKKPGFGEFNLGALAGAVSGSMLGLFAPGLAPALRDQSFAVLFSYPILGVISFTFCAALGWVLGGQLGPRLHWAREQPRLEWIGGVIGGLIPVIMVVCWAWYMMTR